MNIAWRYSSRGRVIESLACSVFLSSFLPGSRCGSVVVTTVIGSVLAVAIVVAEQIIDHKSGCPYPAHLFIDVLAKVGYVENAASIIQTRIRQVFPEVFQHR
jgi:hypothetical protein